MKDVKQKEHMQSAKVLETSQRIPRHAKNISTKVYEQTDSASDRYESTADYAESKTAEYGKDAAGDIGSGAKRASRRMIDKAKEAKTRKESDEPAGTSQAENKNASAYKGGQKHAEKQAEEAAARRQTEIHSSGQYSQRPKTAPQNTVQKIKQIPERTAKSTENTVKTVKRTAKTAKKTVKTAEKTAKETAKAAERAKEAAVKAGQAAVKAAEATAKLVEEVVKIIAEGVKELIAAIAAGGSTALIVIAAIALFACIFMSAFGIFWSNDTVENANPMTAIIRSIDFGYSSGIEGKIAELSQGDYYEVNVYYKGDNDGDSACVYNWDDVLAIYAVKQTTDEFDPTDVIVVTDDTEKELSDIFFSMNHVSYETEIIEEIDPDVPMPTPNPNDPNWTAPEPTMRYTLNIYVTQTAKTYLEAAREYGFTAYQDEILKELMSPTYYTYFADLVGVDIYGGYDLTSIVSNLPTSGKGADVVRAALTRLGAPYVWGAKGSTKFDCSGLSYWSINQVDPELGNKMYTNAAGQAKYCYDRNKVVGFTELQPGDLAFWQNLGCDGCHRWKEVHHVGIYIGDGKVVEASSGKGHVVIRDLWSSKNYPIYMFGRPY